MKHRNTTLQGKSASSSGSKSARGSIGAARRPASIKVPQHGLSRPRMGAPSESDDILGLYMREVGVVPLLTVQEEIELAARIRAGDEAAREHMIRANLRLVVKIARQYEGLGMPLLDLINEGNMGLMKGVERFDPAKGGKLSTYASWWIKQSVRRAIANQGRTIRLPIHATDKLRKAARLAREFREETGREPTGEELSEVLGVRASRLQELQTAAIRPASLDAPIGEDGSTTLGEHVADQEVRDPAEELELKSLLERLLPLVERLDGREKKILKFRFGLNGGGERTLEEIGTDFRLTRERIRQLQNGALQKLRAMFEEDLALPSAA